MKPRTTVEVIGSRATLKLPAIIDTGFSDEVCLPIDIAVGLGLELVNRQKFVLADGSVRGELVFAGRVRFLNKEREVEILLTDLDEALIGVGLLEDCRLTIDFGKGTVDVKPSRRGSKR